MLELALQKALDKYLASFKDKFVEWSKELWGELLQAISDFGFTVSLYGGAALVISRMCGSKRASRYFWMLQIANVFLQGMVL